MVSLFTEMSKVRGGNQHNLVREWRGRGRLILFFYVKFEVCS